MSEFDAVVRLQRGDRAALGDLYAVYSHPAVRIAYTMTGDKALAEDAVHEAFIQVLRSISSLRNPASFRTWFYRIVINAARRRMRRAHQTLPLDLSKHDQPDAHASTPDEATLEAEEVKLLWRAIAQLDAGHRVPIVLRYFIKLSEREIAETLGIPSGTVKSRLHTARSLLRDRMCSPNEPGNGVNRK